MIAVQSFMWDVGGVGLSGSVSCDSIQTSKDFFF